MEDVVGGKEEGHSSNYHPSRGRVAEGKARHGASAQVITAEHGKKRAKGKASSASPTRLNALNALNSLAIPKLEMQSPPRGHVVGSPSHRKLGSYHRLVAGNSSEAERKRCELIVVLIFKVIQPARC